MSYEIGKEFISKTKYQHLGKSAQAEGKPQPPLELSYDETAPLVDLPLPEDWEAMNSDLTNVIQRRRTIRKYSSESLAAAELSYLLWCTQGVQQTISDRTVRTVPSAGARHALETYLLINNVSDIQPGLYRFVASRHKLLPLELDIDGDLANQVIKACNNQVFIKTSAVTFIWTAVAERMIWRYGNRGYRYLHLDAGHVCQNLYLAAEGIDCGVCAIAAYDDDQLNGLLGLDGEAQFAIYLASVGKKVR